MGVYFQPQSKGAAYNRVFQQSNMIWNVNKYFLNMSNISSIFE